MKIKTLFFLIIFSSPSSLLAMDRPDSGSRKNKRSNEEMEVEQVQKRTSSRVATRELKNLLSSYARLRIPHNELIKRVNDLLERGANVNAQVANGDTALIIFSNLGLTNGVTHLLKWGADINIQNQQGMTALMFAVAQDNAAMIKLLLDAKADPNIQDDGGDTALLFAIADGFINSARILIENGADVNISNDNLVSPLMMAASTGDLPIVTLLLQKEVLLDAQGYQGMTALMFAALYNRTQVVIALLDAGANTKIKNRANQTALDIAHDKGFADIEKLIRDAQEMHKLE